MPGWLRALSVANPLTWHTDALRFTTIGIGDPGEVLVKALAFSIFLLLSFGVAVRSLHSAALK
jgi:ABC-type multidrug transport system permease subunit